MSPIRTWRFDGWVLRADLGELTKGGRTIRLQDQPLAVLEELLARPGELVARERLIAKLWPKGVVDFETGLNSAVHKLRVALQDGAEAPRYIETVPRRGYRFIGVIEAEPAATTTNRPPVPGAPAGVRARLWLRGLLAATAAGALMLLIAAASSGVRKETASPGPSSRSESVVTETTLAVLPLNPPGGDETSVLLAQSVTDLIRSRLASARGLIVIAGSSTAALTETYVDALAASTKLGARFVVTGRAARQGDQLRADVQLTDAHAGKPLWSTTYTRPLAEITLMREEIVARIVRELGVDAPPPDSALVDLDAYQLFLSGQQYLSKYAVSDAETALELFQRATILDPRFARAHVGLGQAKLLKMRLTDNNESPDVRASAAQAFERALELQPGLGEAWIEIARLTRAPGEADALYRKGLHLAPSYGVGYLRYAEFLFDDGRAGQAIEVMERARRIDPLTPQLHARQAFFTMVARSDVAKHDQLMREALAINPKLQTAWQQLAYSRWEYSGEFADAAQVVERALALDARSPSLRLLARDIYLDLGDVEAARAVLRGEPLPAFSMIEIAQHERDSSRVAASLRELRADVLTSTGPQAAKAEAVRDRAIETGDFAPALALFEAADALRAARPRMGNRGVAIVRAHTLALAGDVERGRKLAQSTLELLDTHAIGRKADWFSRERASAYAVLGEDGRALDELALAVRDRKLYRWWYLAEQDPLFERVRRDPRFAALNQKAQVWLDQQRALYARQREGAEAPALSAHRAHDPDADRVVAMRSGIREAVRNPKVVRERAPRSAFGDAP